MKNLKIWQSALNCSVTVCVIFVISQMFFKSYIRRDINYGFAIFACVALVVLVGSRVTIFILKKEFQKTKTSKNWKTFSFYEGAIAVFLVANIVFFTINRKLDNPIIPLEFAGHLLWLSSGLYLGFQLCKKGFKNVIKKNAMEQSELDK